MKKLPLLLGLALISTGTSLWITHAGADGSSSASGGGSGVVIDGIRPVDIPPGFGYPGDRHELQRWADQWEIDKITRHAWDLWAGMTSDSGQTWEDRPLPVWETWCGSEEAFSPHGCAASRPPTRSYRLASQLTHAHRHRRDAAPGDTAVVSFNKFNPPMAAYLAALHEGPGKASYSYTSMQSLADLDASWPAATAVASRKVVETPYTPGQSAAVETKPVIFVVKAHGLTPIPLWRGPAGAALGSQLNAVPESWLTCVLLDPANSAGPETRPVPATPLQLANMVPNPAFSCQNYLYAPLSTIYHTRMDAVEAGNWNANVLQTGDGGQCTDPSNKQQKPQCLIRAKAGDFAVLAGMHVNSKAIVNWTWQTFWWQPGDDTPDAFPGSRQGMTDKVRGPWRNYASCTAWNQTQGNTSKNMVVCFNPYLETSTGIPDGQSSNCMSCHATASVGAPALQGSPPSNQITSMNYPAVYIAPLDLTFQKDQCTQSSAGQTCFGEFTRTDFSWAIPVNARVDLPQPATPTPPSGT